MFIELTDCIESTFFKFCKLVDVTDAVLSVFTRRLKMIPLDDQKTFFAATFVDFKAVANYGTKPLLPKL